MPRKANNVDNLIPANKQSKEEARENGRKGGIKSGETRRRKKTIKDTLNTLMSMPLKPDEVDNLEEIKSLVDASGANVTVQEAVIMAQLQKALRGDARSASILIELLKLTEPKTEEAGVQIVDDF